MLIGQTLQRLLRDTAASALLEFAIALPVLTSLYIGAYVVADEVACQRKVGIAARTLADLLSRSISPGATTTNPAGIDASSVMSASVITLTPYGSGNATENVALLRVCDATHAYVIWAQAQTQSATGVATPATPLLQAGTLSAKSVVTVPSGMINSVMIPTSPDGSNVCQNFSTGTSTTTQVGTAGGYLFLGQIDYTYVPAVNLTLSSTVPMGQIIYMSPRLN